MKRYAICAVIGLGTEEDMIRPKIADYASLNWTMISSGPWALVIASGSEYDLGEADSDIDIVVLDCGPDELDQQWGEVVAQPDQQLVTAWTGYEVPTDASVYDVILGLGTSLDPNFAVENFTISE